MTEAEQKDEQPRVLWTPAARRRLQPVRPADPVPYSGPPPWERIMAAWQQVAGEVADGVALAPPEHQPAIKAVLASAAEPPALLDVEVEAARVALLGVGTYGYARIGDPQFPGYNREHQTLDHEGLEAALMAFWLSRADVAFVVEVMTRAERWEPVRRREPAARWFEEEQPESRRYSSAASAILPLWQLLRQTLCAVTYGEYEAAEARAAQVLTEATFSVRCGLAYAFPARGEWANQTALETAANATRLDGRQAWLLASITSRAAAEALVGQISYVGLTDLLFDLLDRVGVDAAPLLKHLARPNAVAGTKRGMVFEVLAMVDSDETFAILAEMLDTKLAQIPAAKAFARSPRRALKALRSVTPTPRTAAMIAQVEAMLRAPADTPPPSGQVEGLPDVLARPPWLQKRRRREPIVVADLTVRDITPRMAWRPGQRARWEKGRWPSMRSTDQRTPESDARTLARFEADTPYLSWVTGLTREGAIEALRRVPPARWFEGGAYWIDESVQQIVAYLELDAVPGLVAMAPHDMPAVVPALAPVCDARVAPVMAEGYARLKSARQIARRWLEAHPREAITALIPPAVGEPGAARDYAESALRFLAEKDGGALVRQISREYGDEAHEAVDRVLTDDPLLRFPSRVPKPPAFWNPPALPAVTLRDSDVALPPDAIDALRVMLMISPLHQPYAGLAIVRDACDRRSLGEFAWAVYAQWETAGRPSKDGWALDALGHLGDDDIADRLTPLIRVWPTSGQLGQATRGLDVLVRIGTDGALMHLYGISQKVKSRPLKLAAADKVQDVASARDLTSEELADRLVPDLGLDAGGSRVLDFGARTFRVGFDEQLKPFVQDADGERLKDLPKPGKADDPEKSAEAAELWKDLKADARKTAKEQLTRLERAMCQRRRWKPSDFQQWLVGHPLLLHLVRRLVWGIFDQDNTLQRSFRVAEDGTFADIADDPYQLPDGARIGIVHRLEISADDARAWSTVLADYQLLPPFPQLQRPVHERTPEERVHPTIDIVEGITVPATKVLGLRTRGWRQGENESGVVMNVIKTLPDDREASLDLNPGLILGDPTGEPQGLGKVVITGGWNDEDEASAAQLDDVTFSEIVMDLKPLLKFV